MAQTINITSEALQKTVRDLLPSQQGFGEDLQASNVIVPTIDLTPSAEGSVLRADLQTALGFGTTHTQVANGTSTVINTTGFFRIYGIMTWRGSTTNEVGSIQLTDGLSTKILWEANILGSGSPDVTHLSQDIDFTTYLRAGDSVTCTSSAAVITFNLTSRQVADINGNLVNPLGFVST
tara:strand:+ start:1533 stop:2069 length:537 start_codon:yes stop_codon:yes gene_type:complete